MTAPDRLVDLFSAAGIGVGLLCIGLLLGQLAAARPARPMHVVALLMLMTAQVLDIGFTLFDGSTLAGRFPGLIGLNVLMYPVFLVALWFYVYGLTTAAPRLSRRHTAHLIPVAITLVCLLPYLLLGVAEKRAFAVDRLDLTEPLHFAAALGVLAFTLLWVLQLGIYGYAVVARLRRHRALMRELCSDTAGVDLDWLSRLMMFIGAALAIAVVDQLTLLADGQMMLARSATAAFQAAIVFGLGLFAINQPAVVPPWASELAASGPPAGDVDAGQSYARSPLADDDCARLAEKLDLVMRRDALWREPFLNLKLLAERANLKPHYVSQALNTARGKNFYEYVNGWRVDAACSALLDTDASVLAICEDVGFNSKSTFNSVFRRVTAMTPSEFRKAAAPAAAQPA